jgi:Septum formation
LRPLVSRCLSRGAAARPTAAEFLAELTAVYPSAADLTDWLPAGIFELSARRVAEADPHPPTAAGSALADSPAGAGLALADAAEPAMSAPPAAEEQPAAEALRPAGHAEDVKPEAVIEPAAHAGSATGGNGSAAPPRTAKSPIPPPSQSVPQGLQGAQAYPAPQGYRGQAGSGGHRDRGGQDGPGGSWPQDTPGWEASQQPDGGAQQTGGGTQAPPPMPYPTLAPDGPQPPYPGPQANQWYSQLMQPGPRRRARWPWAVGAVAAVCALILVAVVLSLGSGHHPAAAGSSASVRPSPTTPSTTPTPTVGSLELNQLRAGDCLTGANMELNTNNPWPKLTLAVPCNQPHTAEVFFADNNFWRRDSPFPGNGTINKDGNAACDNAFRSYVGIAYSKSIYTWTNIIPDATTWPTGDRALHCVAYYSTPQQLAGATLTRSIKNTRR